MKNQNLYCIVGAGSMGCLMAFAFQQAAIPVTLLVKETAPKIYQQKISVATVSSFQQPIQRVIIATKIYDVITAIKQIQSRLTNDAEILLCHNGMGIHEEVIKLLPHHNVGMLITNYGAHMRAPFEVVLAGQGLFQLGYLNQNKKTHEQEWLNIFQQAKLNIQYENNIEFFMQRKLIINASINGLTAIYGCKNGQLIQSNYLYYLVNQLADEAILVLQQNEKQMKPLIFSVIEKTAENFSATLQDVKNHRKTEIPFINGFILKEGLKLGLNLPYHKLICQLFGDH